MDYMFNSCSSLKFLDISNFNITSNTSKYCIFCNIQNLLFLNIKNIYSDNYNILSNLILENPNSIYCFNNKEKTENDLSNNIKNNCSNNCFLESKIIIEKQLCIINCTEDEGYKFEYNKRCYNNLCPEGTHSSSENIFF